MDYRSLVREAWATTWRYRFLWILGLLAGATGGSLSVGRYSMPAPERAELPSEATALAAQAQAWMLANLGLVVGLAIGAAVIGLALAVVSVIARGGITQATVDALSGQPTSLGRAWRAGRRWFWRFLGLLVLLAVIVSVVVGSVAAVAVNLGGLGVLFGALALTAGAVASIVLAYAERAIVVRDLGPIAALRHAWQVFTDHLSASLLTWLISVLLSVAVGVAAAVAIGLLVAFFGGIGLALWFASGLSAGLLLNAGVAVAVVIALLVTVAAIANTFFWSYWTVAYLRLDPPVTA
ncbi:MAG: hypothetical protein M3336_03400 [Chloroflexota bacterium]|nr:hypothetical protein [Chloroflexota bacterium]